MGLAAGQARLLLLTARKSDLEFRAQQITNAEMMLAMQTEDIARQYSIKMSNQTVMKLDKGSDRQSFTLDDLLKNEYEVVGLENIKEYIPDEELSGYFYTGNDEEIKKAFNEATKGKYGLTTNEWMLFTKKYKLNPETDGQVMKKESNATLITGTDLLRYYREGLIKIYKPDGEELSFDSDTGFAVCYDTSDDRQAEAEYQQATAAIQVKEKRLQMELIQIETQQKACETEMESVKKVVDKNADKTFKYFS